MRRTVASLALLAMLVMPGAARAEPSFTTVPARDGTPLSICVLMPEGDGPFPTAFEWSGYSISDITFPAGGCPAQHAALAERLVADGYAFVAGNPRGVGASGGERWDFWSSQNGRDGADVVEWIAAQPWSNGNVGVVGCSGSAQDGIMVAAEAPAALKAAAFACFTADPYRGAYYPGGMMAWTWQVLIGRPFHDLGVNATSQMVARGDDDWTTRALAPAELWADMHTHDTYDAFWADKQVLSRLERFPPTYAFGAWMDFFGIGAGEFARAARPGDRVLIHPGGHGVTMSVTGPYGGLERVHAFFDYHLRDEVTADPFAGEDPILFYETLAANNAANFGSPNDLDVSRYRASASWPPASVSHVPWYLRGARSNSQASLNDGSLSAEPPNGDEMGDAFVYPSASPGSLHDVRQTFVGQNYDAGVEVTGGAVTYTSAPLAEPLHLAGSPTLSFWATTTAPDTDWVVRLIDVDPAGQPRDITNGWLKASHRALDPSRTEMDGTEVARAWHTHTHPEPVPLLEPVEYHVELWDIATEIPAGHRIKVWISSGETYFFTQKTAPSVNTVLHDAAHPSRIVLPVAG